MVSATAPSFEELADLRQGVLEAGTLYQPCLDAKLKAEEDTSDSNPVAVEKRKTMQTIFLSANVDSIVNNEELSEEMWANWASAEEGENDHAPLQLLSDNNDLEYVSVLAVEALQRLVSTAAEDLAARNEAALVAAPGRGEAKAVAIWVMGTEQGMDYYGHGASAYTR
jgi:hypothetical protein